MLKLPRIYLFKVGSVPSNFINLVMRVLNNFYGSLRGVLLPEFVEVYVYGTSREKIMFLEAEARDIGVIAIGDFITVHEAWRGWPRIHVDYEKCYSLKQSYIESLLVHEASHSIIHGSPLYYLIDIDQQLISKFGYEYAVKISYIASTVVKDLDVQRFLVEQGYRNHVEKYLEFLIDIQLKDTKCDDVLSVLEFMKVLTPCVFLEDKCLSIERILREDCRSLVNEVVRVLKELTRSYQHLDLSQRTILLARKTIEMLEKYEYYY